MRIKKEKLVLPCILTDAEKLEFSRSLTLHISDKKKCEDNLKSMASQIKAEIQAHEGNINSYAEKISTGREYREIFCEIVYDFSNRTKSWVRTDTGEVVKAGTISEEELQENIPLYPDDSKQAPVEVDAEVESTTPRLSAPMFDE